MWGTVLPHTSCSWEPVELRILKQELANLACKCNTCESFKNPLLHLSSHQNDEAVQVDQRNHLLDKYVYAISDLPPDVGHQANMMDNFRNDVFCPNCYFIWELLRRTTKVFKDEGSEMKPELSDKSTEKSVNLADNTTTTTATSLNNKSALKPSSNLMLCDFISDCSSDSSLNHCNNDLRVNFEMAQDKKKNNHDRVTFLDDYPSQVEAGKEPPTFTMQGTCFCVDNYMNAIRPPLKFFYE